MNEKLHKEEFHARISMSYGQMSKIAGLYENSAVGVILLILDIFPVRPFLTFQHRKYTFIFVPCIRTSFWNYYYDAFLFLFVDNLIGSCLYCMPAMHYILCIAKRG